MLNSTLYDNLRLILDFLFNTILHNVWILYTSTILAFVVMTWLFAHLIKFFKRFI